MTWSHDGKQRRRPGFITIHRDALVHLRSKLGPKRSAMCFFLELLAQADAQTGEVIGSMRWLAGELGLSRNTVASHVKILTKAKLITVQKAPGGAVETVLEIADYGWLVGLEDAFSPEDGSRTEPLAPAMTSSGSIGGSDVEPRDTESGSIGGSIGGSEAVPRDRAHAGETRPRTSRPSRPIDPQEFDSPNGSPLPEGKSKDADEEKTCPLCPRCSPLQHERYFAGSWRIGSEGGVVT